MIARPSAKIEQRMNAASVHRRWTVRLALPASAVFICTPVAVLGGVEPATAASPVVNGSVEEVPRTAALNGIACNTADFCVAVGSHSGQMEGDLNPWAFCAEAFQELRISPLCHPSGEGAYEN
jgi:hypothetical protein